MLISFLTFLRNKSTSRNPYIWLAYNLYKFILLMHFAKALKILLLYVYLLFLIGIVF